MLKSVLTGLALMTAATPAMLAAAQSTAETVSAAVRTAEHQEWTAILGKYVKEAGDGVNRFDYAALKADAEDLAALEAYIASFAEMDFDAMTRDEQFAAWGNLYNAVTVQHIIGRYPVRSIRSGYIVGPWKRVDVVAGGREVSLDDIEHKILRENWDEPRVHYMVNCASYGCPNLMPRAWEAATLEADLEAAASAYINHPRGVTIRNNGTLQVSTIYKWFRADFGGSNDGVIEHLLKYAEPELAEKIRANPRITKHVYDWSLNDA